MNLFNFYCGWRLCERTITREGLSLSFCVRWSLNTLPDWMADEFEVNERSWRHLESLSLPSSSRSKFLSVATFLRCGQMPIRRSVRKLCNLPQAWTISKKNSRSNRFCWAKRAKRLTKIPNVHSIGILTLLAYPIFYFSEGGREGDSNPRPNKKSDKSLTTLL